MKVRYLKFVLLLAMVLSFGCLKNESDNENDPSDGWLSVTSEKKALTDARLRAKEIQTAEFESIFSSLGDPFGYFVFESLEILNRHEDAIPRLKSLLSGEMITAKKVGAAVLLCHMYDVDGRNYCVRVLKDGDKDVREQVLHGINNVTFDEDEENKYKEFLFEDNSLIHGLLKQLDDNDPQVVKAAIQTCGILKVPGVHKKFMNMLKLPDVPDRGRILFWLSEGPLTEEVFNLAIKLSEDAPEKDDHWGVSIFEKYARHGDPVLRERSRKKMKQEINEWHDDGSRGYDGQRITILSVLAETSTEKDIPWLEDRFNKENGYYAEPLLEALIRLEGSKGKKRLLKLLSENERHPIAVGAAGEVYKNTHDEDLVQAIAGVASDKNDRDLQQICAALQSIGGKKATEELGKIIERLAPEIGAQFKGTVEGYPTLEEIKLRLASSGLLTDKVLNRAILKTDMQLKKNPDRKPDLFDVLAEAKILLMFDAETGMLPCRHDKLVEDFSAFSGGVFNPTAITEEWHRKHEEDFEAEYILRFILGNNLYSGKLRNFGDWYDVERTVVMLNRALADSKVKERFIALATGDQTALFVCADPEIFTPMAKEFHLPLGEDPAEAMKKGKEYEQKVFDQLKSAGEEVIIK